MSHCLSKEDRTMYLSMADRMVKPGAGTHPSVLRERTAHYSVPKLNKYLKGITFAVVGGLATRLYMPERATRAHFTSAGIYPTRNPNPNRNQLIRFLWYDIQQNLHKRET